MKKALLYINYPHYLLYWVLFKTKYNSLKKWKEVVDNGRLDGTLKSAVELIEKYGIEDD